MYAGSQIVEVLAKDRERFTHTERSWIRAQRGHILCEMCLKRRPDVYPMPIDIPIRQLRKGTSYDMVFHGGVAAIHVGPLAFLEPFMQGHVLGKCVWWRDHAIMTDYRSVYLRPGITVRGDSRTQYHVCAACRTIGSISYEPYVLRGELLPADVFQDPLACLYLSEDLARRLPWREFPDITPHVVPVRDEPLPDDPFPGASYK